MELAAEFVLYLFAGLLAALVWSVVVTLLWCLFVTVVTVARWLRGAK